MNKEQRAIIKLAEIIDAMELKELIDGTVPYYRITKRVELIKEILGVDDGKAN